MLFGWLRPIPGLFLFTGLPLILCMSDSQSGGAMSRPTCLDSFCCAFIGTSSKLAKHSSCGVLPQNQTQQTKPNIYAYKYISVAQIKFSIAIIGLLSYLILLGLWHFLRCRLSWSCLFHRHLREENVKDSVKMFCIKHISCSLLCTFWLFLSMRYLSFSAYPYKLQKCPPPFVWKQRFRSHPFVLCLGMARVLYSELSVNEDWAFSTCSIVGRSRRSCIIPLLVFVSGGSEHSLKRTLATSLSCGFVFICSLL